MPCSAAFVSGLRAAIHQRRDETQERLVLWVMRPAAEKGADVEVRYMTARRHVRFMPDEDALRIGITTQKPTISVGTAVKISSQDRH